MEAYWLNIAVSSKGTRPCFVDGLNGFGLFMTFQGTVKKVVLVKFAAHAYLLCGKLESVADPEIETRQQLRNLQVHCSIQDSIRMFRF